ncbi:TIGR04255 family protein [Flavobacterium hauense]
MLDQFLKPISKKHSIRNVVATVFLAQNVLKIETLFDKLNNVESICKSYPRRNKTTLRTIRLDDNIKQDKINGFVFESFDVQGRLENILRLVNQSDNTTALTFETRRYENWENYLNKLVDDLSVVSDNYKFFISAISLSYIDEFTWVNSEKIPVKEIFNVNSELINNKFLNSDNATLILHSQAKEDVDSNEGYEEKTEISFGNRLRKVIINHQYVKTFDSFEDSNEALTNDLLTGYFQKAHNINKDVLKEVLSQEVLKLINLN